MKVISLVTVKVTLHFFFFGSSFLKHETQTFQLHVFQHEKFSPDKNSFQFLSFQKMVNCFYKQIFKDENFMSVNFDRKNFNIHLGTDGLVYATSKTSSELFVFTGWEWLTFDEFISIDDSTLEAMREDFNDF